MFAELQEIEAIRLLQEHKRSTAGSRMIAWPPRGEVVMDVFGFQEAVKSAHEIVLPGAVRASVVSLPALALLKLICWNERHYVSPGKDAHDLMLILKNYLPVGNEARLWGEFAAWTQDEGFDYECAGARMLGHDVRALLDEKGVQRVSGLLGSKRAQPCLRGCRPR